jgi:hypothetical protein
MRCDQCEALMINGVFCHETGCPNSKKTYRYGAWILIVRCPNCNSDVEAGTECDECRMLAEELGEEAQ